MLVQYRGMSWKGKFEQIRNDVLTSKCCSINNNCTVLFPGEVGAAISHDKTTFRIGVCKTKNHDANSTVIQVVSTPLI